MEKQSANNNSTQSKKWLTAFLLSLLVGIFGADRFYLGKIGSGIAKLLTLGGLGIWVIVDFVLIATKSMPGVEWQKDGSSDKKIAWGAFAAAVVFSIFVMATSPDVPEVADSQDSAASTQIDKDADDSNDKSAKQDDKTAQEKMFESVNGLIAAGKAYDTGSYVKGQIPEGEYAFVSFDGSSKYYSEEDSTGNIIDNESFDSFGYVYVHSSGNLETQGVLISRSSLRSIGVKGAKEVYEKLNDVSNFNGGGMYAAGADIVPGQYTLKSLGEGYAELMSGPVGNSSIVDNEIFNGMYSVNVAAGQYLKLSRAEIQ